MKKFIMGICLAFCLVGQAFGQTNPAPASTLNPQPSTTSEPSPAWLDKTSTDASALLGDFGVTVSSQEIRGLLSLGIAAFFIARAGRKAIPDAWQTGKLGLVLKHIALEVNPTSAPPAPPSSLKGYSPAGTMIPPPPPPVAGS